MGDPVTLCRRPDLLGERGDLALLLHSDGSLELRRDDPAERPVAALFLSASELQELIDVLELGAINLRAWRPRRSDDRPEGVQ